MLCVSIALGDRNCKLHLAHVETCGNSLHPTPLWLSPGARTTDLSDTEYSAVSSKPINYEIRILLCKPAPFLTIKITCFCFQLDFTTPTGILLVLLVLVKTGLIKTQQSLENNPITKQLEQFLYFFASHGTIRKGNLLEEHCAQTIDSVYTEHFLPRK